MILDFNMESRVNLLDGNTVYITPIEFFNACEIGDFNYVESVVGDTKRDWGELYNYELCYKILRYYLFIF